MKENIRHRTPGLLFVFVVIKHHQAIEQFKFGFIKSLGN